MVLICTYLKTKNFETLTQLFWENVCLSLLPILNLIIIFCCLLSARSSLYILDTSLFMKYITCEHILPQFGCLFSLLLVFSDALQKFEFFIRHTFFLLFILLMLYLRNHCQIEGYKAL